MQQKRIFYTSAVCYIISSASILFMDISIKIISVLAAILFWFFLILAITAQWILYRIQKQKQPLIQSLLLKPTLFFTIGFMLGIVSITVLKSFYITGFLLLFLFSIVVICFELMILTRGKFRRQNGKISFMVYKTKLHTRSEMK